MRKGPLESTVLIETESKIPKSHSRTDLGNKSLRLNIKVLEEFEVDDETSVLTSRAERRIGVATRPCLNLDARSGRADHSVGDVLLGLRQRNGSWIVGEG